MNRLRLSLAAVIFCLISAFPVLAQQMPMHLPIDPVALTINTAKGDVPFTVEIADNEEERQRGLMFRTDLKDNSAMLLYAVGLGYAVSRSWRAHYCNPSERRAVFA